MTTRSIVQDWKLWALGIAACVGFTGVAIGSGADLAVVALLTGVIGGMVVYCAGGFPGVVAVVFGVLAGGLLVPTAGRAACEAVLLAAGTGSAAVVTLRSHGAMRIAAGSFVAACGLYVLGMLNPNVPSAWAGALGMRATVVAPACFFIGVALANRGLERPTRTAVLATLVLGGVLALALHVLAPGLEAQLPRRAEEATGMLRGEARMQGQYSGPFHVAMLGAFLLYAGATRWAGGSRVLALPLLVLGGLSLYYAKVRTGYVAAGAALLLVLIVGPLLAARVSRGLSMRFAAGALAIVAGAALGAGVLAQHDPALSSLPGLQNDSRVLDRAASIERGVSLVRRSPLFGWGPGAASSAMRYHFAGREYEVPHSGVLIAAIEAGVSAAAAILCLWTALALATWERLRARQATRGADTGVLPYGLGALTIVAIFWAFGDAFAALPVSAALMLIGGLWLGKCEGESARV